MMIDWYGERPKCPFKQLTEASMSNLQYKDGTSAYIIPLQTTDDIIGRSVPFRKCRFQPLPLVVQF